MSNITVRSFNGTKYLLVGVGCNIEEIENIGEVIDDMNIESESGRVKVVKAETVAITAVDVYKGCRNYI